ncbi:cytokine receptor-like factor 3 isoform X2 [Amphibalanus amphitrite]|uniref:cytokine receptor-like factor 3 isoform X2 n=1 Tax=Amphibalanus amphitrite TaxID=1232801 RepID=UPI001C9284D7|nr:cytokine receptor-like factor 3 isoform X2 [Amphibalanus amphitrite]
MGLSTGEDSSKQEGLEDLKSNLEMYLDHLNEAKVQIQSSADQTEAALESAMAAVLQQVSAALDERKAQLMKEVADVKNTALKQAESCSRLAQEHLQRTEELLGSLQSGDSLEAKQMTAEAIEELASQLPAPSSLPRPALQLPSSGAVLAAVRQLGRVESTVTVAGYEDDCDPSEGDGSYRLQYCYGDANKQTSPVFHTAYEGPETSTLVRRLQCDVIYSFRVSRQVSAGGAWGGWSPPVTGATTLPHYEWSPSPAYSITDSGRIACRTGDGGDTYTGGDSVIYSAGAQLRPGAALRVAVVEAGSGCSDEGLALLDGRPDQGEDGALIGKGALFVSATGEVYVNGRRRQMRLPPLQAGSYLTFSTERRDQQTTRVCLETGDKQVVYDWKTESTDLWLAASFNELGWKLMLE